MWKNKVPEPGRDDSAEEPEAATFVAVPESRDGGGGNKTDWHKYWGEVWSWLHYQQDESMKLPRNVYFYVPRYIGLQNP